MNRVSTILALAVVAAIALQASARVQLAYTTSTVQPLNTRTPDDCARDNLYNAVFNSAVRANGATSALSYGSCTSMDAPFTRGLPAALMLPAASSTILAPTVISREGYTLGQTYTVTIIGTDFDDLFATVPLGETVIGTVYLSNARDSCSAGPFVSAPVGAAAGVTTGTRPLVYVSNTQLRFDIQPNGAADWLSASVLSEISTIPLCFNLAAAAATNGLATGTGVTAIYTGFQFGAVYSCVTNAGCGRALDVLDAGLPFVELSRRLTQGLTTCCAGQCINPNVQSCCGTAGTAFETNAERCCDGTRGTLATLDTACPCRLQIGGGAPVCPADEPVCCLPTKFQELIPTGCTGPTPSATCFTQVGQCYNPINRQCCDTGFRYDPGAQQCCAISGIASIQTPCPCETDIDCEGGATQGSTRTPNLNQRCCRQTAPELGAVDGQQCSAFQNFPSGQISVRATRCRGTCFDARFQICCNGATCVREYEQCCNATCCNLFTSTCFDSARRTGTSNNIANFREFGLRFAQCSTVENLETVSVFWVYIIPAAFLISTLAILALGLVFTSKASVRMFSLLEKMIIAVGVIITIVSCALYFSPAYKYGIVFSMAAVFAIIASAARVRWLTVLALIAVGLSAWYLLDPWHGNDYLTLSYWRIANGNPDPRTAGLFETLGMLFPDRDQIEDINVNQCVIYYNYFALDPLLQDLTRFNNPAVRTFGYCTRGWITALLVLAGILWASLVFLFALLVLALILRFRKDRSAPIELEVRPEPFIGGAGMYGAPTAFVDPYAAAMPFVPAY